MSYGRDSNPAREAAPDSVEDVPAMRPMASDRLVQLRQKKSRRPRVTVPSVQGGSPKPFALIGETPAVPSVVGPALCRGRAVRLCIGFGEAVGHPTRKGLHIIRHMLPWWEPDELSWLEDMLGSDGYEF